MLPGRNVRAQQMNRLAPNGALVTLRLTLLAGALISSFAWAGEVGIELLEKQTNAVTTYSFDPQSSRLKPVQHASGKEIPQFSKYGVRERKVILNGNPLADAEEILYQCEVNGTDVLIVRVEHNSFSSPMKWLAAFSGHPIQVSTINILTVIGGELKDQTRIEQKDSSYRWSAKILR